jgi:hypothetical protein
VDDFERLRIERDLARVGFARPPRGGSGTFLGRVTTASPTVGKFINVIPQGLLGTESEGSAGTATDLGSTPIPVYLVSGTVATGDQVVSRFVDFRWVTRRRGGGGGILCPGCTSPSYPTTLYATVPALGFSRLPIHSSGGGPWLGCGTASVLGYPVCGTFSSVCSPTTITAAFRVALSCFSGTPPIWRLVIGYVPVQGYGCVPSLTGTEIYRAVNAPCAGDILGFCGGFGSSSLGGFWNLTNTCPTLGTLTFSGAPTFSPPGIPPIPNFYFGTSATVDV